MAWVLLDWVYLRCLLLIVEFLDSWLGMYVKGSEVK